MDSVLLGLVIWIILPSTISAQDCPYEPDIQLIKVNGDSYLVPTGTLKSVEYTVSFDCPLASNAKLSWTDLSGNPISNSTMFVTVTTNLSTSHNLSEVISGDNVIIVDWTNMSNVNLTLKAPEIESSFLKVSIDRTDGRNGTRQVPIAGKCTSGKKTENQLWPDSETVHNLTEVFLINCNIPMVCAASSGRPEVTKGKMKMQCAVDSSWEVKEECVPNDEVVSISPSANTIRDLPDGAKAHFKCNSRNHFSVEVVGIDGHISNETYTIEKINLANHHGEIVKCRWTNNSNPNHTMSGNATLNVLTSPLAKHSQSEMSESPIKGASAELHVPFWSNPPVKMGNVSVTKGDGHEYTDFYFKSVEIHQAVLIYFPKVTSKDYADYHIRVLGQDQFCNPINVTFKAVLQTSPIAIHPGYIITIVLGCLLLLAIIAIVIVVLKYFKNSKSSHSSNNIQMAPAKKISQPVDGAKSLPRTNHQNQQYQHDTTDDEFDTDDEAGSRDLDSRPPMPVPPPPRTPNLEPSNPHSRPPPSPIPQRYQQHNLPPPRGANPPPPPSPRSMDGPPLPPAHRGFEPPPPAHRGFEPSPQPQRGFEPPPPAHRGFEPPQPAHRGYEPPPPAHRGFEPSPQAHRGFQSEAPQPPAHRGIVPPMRDVRPPPPPPASRRPELPNPHRGPGYNDDVRTRTLPQQRGMNNGYNQGYR